MNDKDIKIYQDRYNNRLKEFGYDPKSLGWGGGTERQWIRFNMISKIGIADGDSILDVGAGFGDFSEFLKEKNLNIKYTAYELNPNLIKVANKVYPEIKIENKNLLNDDINERFDWIVSCGIFNAKLKHEDSFTYIKNMIAKMFKQCDKGVCCDFMTSYVDFQNELAFHMDPAELIPFLKSLTDRIVINMDYLKYEFSIYLYKTDLK